jgi:hypothetical protein
MVYGMGDSLDQGRADDHPIRQAADLHSLRRRGNPKSNG